MEAVKYTVPLCELYKLMASCNFSMYNNYCPVLLKIMDTEIQIHNGRKKYLLQVWSIKGELVFERALHSPIVNWNIMDDVFLFQQTLGEEVLTLVRLYPDRQAQVYEIVMPQSAFAGNADDDLVNTDFKNEKFVVPVEIIEEKKKQDDPGKLKIDD